MNQPPSVAPDPTEKGQPLGDLLDEISAAIEAGEPVDVDAFIRRAPQHAVQIRRAAKMLQALDELELSTVNSLLQSRRRRDGGLPTDTLGDFRIVREIGRGGMGVVYEAEQISLGRRVALKVLPLAGMLDSRQLQRFQHEARAAACLHHPNIVPVHSVGCERGVHYYAMQLIEGQTLAQLIRQLAGGKASPHPPDGRRDADFAVEPQPATSIRDAAASLDVTADAAANPTEPAAPENDTVRGAADTTDSFRSAEHFRAVAELGIQVAEALEYAHSLGIIHRDIKPSNLLIDAAGRPWIADFGLAHVEAEAGMTLTGELVGTLRYMSPEQAQGLRRLVDGRSDIYSLGVTLYELLTGRPAFSATNRQKLLRQVIEDEPSAPRQIDRAIPVDLETILLKAIAKEPRARYAAAQELADDLRRFLELRPILAKRPGPAEIATKWVRRHPAVLAAAIVILLATSTALGISTLLISRAFEQEGRERQRAETAMIQEAAQRREAEKLRVAAEDNFRDAMAAVRQMLVHVSKERLKDIPQMHQVRSELMSDAADFYNRLVARRPEDRDVRFEAAQAFNFLGDLRYRLQEGVESEQNYRRALELLERTEQSDAPKTADQYILEETIHRQLALTLKELNRFDDCIKSFRTSVQTARDLVRNFPDVPEHRHVLGRALATLGDYHTYSRAHRDLQAAEEYARESLLNSSAESAYTTLGRVLVERREYDEARTVLLEALDCLDVSFWTYVGLANVETMAGRHEEALGYHDKSYRLQKDYLLSSPGELQSVLQWERTVAALFKMLNQKGAEDVRELALDILDFSEECLGGTLATTMPVESRGAFQRVEREIFFKHLSPSEALQHARRAYERRPSDSLRLVVAQLLVKTGRLTEADELLADMAIPDDPVVLLEMAEVKRATGDLNAASEYYHKALNALQPALSKSKASNTFRGAAEKLLDILPATSLGPDERRRIKQEIIAFCEEFPADWQLTDLRATIYVHHFSDNDVPRDERFRYALAAFEGVPTEPYVHKRIAWCHYHLRNFDDALQYLRNAIDLNPQDVTNFTWYDALSTLKDCSNDEFLRELPALSSRAVELTRHHPDHSKIVAVHRRLLGIVARRAYADGWGDQVEEYAREIGQVADELMQSADKALASQEPSAKPRLASAAVNWVSSQLIQREVDLDELAALLARFEKAREIPVTAPADATAAVPERDREQDIELGHALWELGKMLREQQAFDEALSVGGEALQLFQQLAREFPDDAYMRQETAYSHRHLADTCNAIADYRAAAEHLESAVTLYRELAAAEPGKRFFVSEAAVTRMVLAFTKQGMGQDDEADALLTELLDLRPDNPPLLNHLAWLLATAVNPEHRDPDRAVELAGRAVGLEENGDYWNTLGVARYRAGDYPGAIEALERSNRLSGEQDTAFDAFFLAMAHHRLDDQAEARRWLVQAIAWMDEHEPENEELLRFRAEAEELLKSAAGR